MQHSTNNLIVEGDFTRRVRPRIIKPETEGRVENKTHIRICKRHKDINNEDTTNILGYAGRDGHPVDGAR